MKSVKTISYSNGVVRLIDQTKLPQKCVYLTCRDVKSLWRAIRNLSVRGAPALGAAAGYGVCLGIKNLKSKNTKELIRKVERVSGYLGKSRPTAVNLFYALDRMKSTARKHGHLPPARFKKRLLDEAKAIAAEDQKMNRALAQAGQKLIRSGNNILTICNTGALATVDYGTALGVLYSAKAKGKKFRVYTCETRPLLQGARLNAWELLRAKIDTTLICDSMAAALMQQKKIDLVITGADRIAANGDTANKIGTYNLAVLARFHKIPFYVAAPRTTFDKSIKSAKAIPIEQRPKEEILGFNGHSCAPKNVKVFNPAFDVTPHRLITAIITEKGIIRPPFKKRIEKLLCRPQTLDPRQ